MKRITMLTYLLSIIQFFILSSCNLKSEREVYIIPEKFIGKVNIIFNRKDGVLSKYENGTRLYEIPGNGILLTQFKTNDGWSERNYYYRNKAGGLKKINLLDMNATSSNANIDKSEVGIFLNGTSGVYGNSGQPSALEYQEFIVSSYNSIDSFFSSDYRKSFKEKIDRIRMGQ